MKGTISFDMKIVGRSRKEIFEKAVQGPRSRLHFEFLDDLFLDLPFEEVVDTFRVLLSTTSAPPQVVEAMLPLWLHGYGMQIRKCRKAALYPLLAPEMKFNWPFFEKWEKHFLSLDLWPEGLPRTVDEMGKPLPGRDAIIIAMLDSFLGFKIYNRRDAAKMRPDDLHHRWGWHLHTMNPQNAKIVDGMAAGVDLMDWTTYPPFFPGDRTDIVLNRSPRQRSM